MTNLNVMFRTNQDNIIEMVYINNNSIVIDSINGKSVSSYEYLVHDTIPFEDYTDNRVQMILKQYLNNDIKCNIVDNVFCVETQWETLPQKVISILETITDDTYELCEIAITNLNEIHWGADYGLDGIIHSVYPLN